MKSKIRHSTWLGGVLAVVFAAVNVGVSAATSVPVSQTPDSEAEVITPPAFVVTTGRYRSVLTPGEHLRLGLYHQFRFDFGWPAIGPFVLTPGHTPQSPRSVACTVQTVDFNESAHSPSGTLEGALRSVVDFSLSGRRDNSLAPSHEQGVALRGTGARGAGALVLRDGVPINDPFGGWVIWPEVPREGLYRAEIVSGGGATAWGNGTLGGVVQFITVPANGRLVDEPGTPNDGGPPDPNLTKRVVRPATQMSANFGQYGTRSVEFVSSQPTDSNVVQLQGRRFTSDGYHMLSSENRGPIDRAVWSRHSRVEARLRQPLGKNRELTATVRGYSDSHGEGTPDRQNHSRGEFASVALASGPSIDFAWNATGFVRHRSYRANLTTVDSARSTETPLINKSSAPATAFGASWTGLWWDSGQGRTVAGSDLSFVRGEVREKRAFSQGRFTRELVAGGEQGMAGFFVSRDQPVGASVHATMGARLDVWKDTDGHRREFDRPTGIQLSNDPDVSNRGVEASPSVGIVWSPSGNWSIRTNAQMSFRRPTLGERYETYSNHFIITEANPDLRTEHNAGLEIGAQYRPSTAITLGATGFSNEMRDAQGSLRVARGSGASPLVDALPSGYFVQKRINLDRARVRGLKLSAGWNPGAALSLDAAVLFNDATILRSTMAPQLDGQTMARVSRRTVVMNATWRAPGRVTFRLRLRALGREFVDDENTLRLGDVVLADVEVSHALTAQIELYLTADNLADTVVATSRSDDGLTSVGAPRFVLAGIRARW